MTEIQSISEDFYITTEEGKKIKPIEVKEGILHKEKSWNFLKKTKSISKKENAIKELREKINNGEITKSTANDLLDKITDGKIESEEPLKEPGLFLLTSKGVQVFENVQPGLLTRKRSDGRESRIILKNNKLQSLNWGDQKVKAWFCDENEATPYPVEPSSDSGELSNVMQEIMVNKKDLMTTRLKAMEGMGWTVIIGIAIILAIVLILPQMVTGKDVFTMMADANPTDTPDTVQTNTINEVPDADLTPEQQAKIDQIKNGEVG
jgi:hypothetical protein